MVFELEHTRNSDCELEHKSRHSTDYWKNMKRSSPSESNDRAKVSVSLSRSTHFFTHCPSGRLLIVLTNMHTPPAHYSHRQRQRSSTPKAQLSDDEGYAPYVPLKERRRAEVRSVDKMMRGDEQVRS